MRPDRTNGSLLILPAALMLVALLGCGRENFATQGNPYLSSKRLAQLAPGGASSGFYPLEVGNHWQYDRVFTLQFAPDADPSDTIRSEVSRELIGQELMNGRQYVVEEQIILQDSRPGEVFTNLTHYRQDLSGLYYLDTSPTNLVEATTAEIGTHQAALDEVIQRLSLLRKGALGARAAGKPGGAFVDEVMLLQYPLRPGASWVLREDPRFVYTVEGVETLDLPVGKQLGYRIRVDLGLEPDPNSSVHVWFGRIGFLGYRISFVQLGGNPFPYFEGLEEEWLTDASLTRNAVNSAK